MFLLTGTVLHVFESPKGISKKTGEEYGGQDKVQIMGEVPLPNGEFLMDMLSLTSHDTVPLKKLIGKPVSIPVGFMAQSKGVITYFIPKGAHAIPQAS
mgnify:CR=1 FL=1